MAKHNSLNELFTATANAIRSKTGSTDPIVADDFPSAIEGIEAGGSGGGVVYIKEQGVNFYDYDGTLLHSYSVEEANALSELPPLPGHPGLICQGWNWSLDSIKSHNRAVNVGANYITDDGATRIYIRLEEGRISPMLSVSLNGTATVDWGDGTAPDVISGTSTTSGTLASTPNHEYVSAGEYVIRLTVDGEVAIKGAYSDYTNFITNNKEGYSTPDQSYRNAIQRIELGNNITSIGIAAFGHCYSLISITIPDGVTSINNKAFSACRSLAAVTIPDGVTTIGEYAFSNCYSLISTTIPDGVTNIGNYAFSNCGSLTSVTIPDGVTRIGNGAFSNCGSLTSITIPDGVTSIATSTFDSCYSLTSITIPDGVTTIGTKAFYTCRSLAAATIPYGVTSIGDNAFYGCRSLAAITIPDGVTTIGGSIFSNCESLASVTIPDGVTSIGSSAFNACESLASVTIPDGVTSIGSSAFNACESLASITIPASVANIGAKAFTNCCGVAYYDFSSHAIVPTLSNTNAFSNIYNDCEIRVPAALYDEWIAATNWSTYADYIVAV